MNPVPPSAFPGSRTVAAWWRELQPHRPLRLWLCHLLIHRVEALADVARTTPLTGLRLEVLRSLAAGSRPEGLDAALLASLCRDLAAAGVVACTPFGPRPTDAGRQALAVGSVTAITSERWTFCFADKRERGRPPHFIGTRVRGIPVSPPEPWEFDPDLLRAASDSPPAWKERFRFPADVSAVRLPAPDDNDWRKVVLDRAEYLFAALVAVEPPGGRRELRGFLAHTENWSLEAREPILELGAGWEDAMSDLAADPPGEDWRRAWQAVARQRGLTPAEASACRPELSGHLLRVEVPRELLTRLRDARGEAKGETWLLAGTGHSRAAARMEITERNS
jgi:hypothetical protein